MVHSIVCTLNMLHLTEAVHLLLPGPRLSLIHDGLRTWGGVSLLPLVSRRAACVHHGTTLYNTSMQVHHPDPWGSRLPTFSMNL